MKSIAGVLICLFFIVAAKAQSYNIDETGEVIYKQYQIFLTEPANNIQELENMEGEKIKGTLSPDGNKIIIDDYNKKEKLRVKVEYESGRIEEFTRSPCFIDPLIM
jgi:hypothetical protein